MMRRRGAEVSGGMGGSRKCEGISRDGGGGGGPRDSAGGWWAGRAGRSRGRRPGTGQLRGGGQGRTLPGPAAPGSGGEPEAPRPV